MPPPPEVFEGSYRVGFGTARNLGGNAKVGAIGNAADERRCFA